MSLDQRGQDLVVVFPGNRQFLSAKDFQLAEGVRPQLYISHSHHGVADIVAGSPYIFAGVTILVWCDEGSSYTTKM